MGLGRRRNCNPHCCIDGSTHHSSRRCCSSIRRGWKKRVSIKPSIRERWTGENQLADLVQQISEEWSGTSLQRIDVEGEPGLLLLSGELDGLAISIAVRNSGTEAKTAVSIRFAKGVQADGNALMERLIENLSEHLMP